MAFTCGEWKKKNIFIKPVTCFKAMWPGKPDPYRSADTLEPPARDCGCVVSWLLLFSFSENRTRFAQIYRVISYNSVAGIAGPVQYTVVWSTDHCVI